LEIWRGDEHALGLIASLLRETSQLGRRRLTVRHSGRITAHRSPHNYGWASKRPSRAAAAPSWLRSWRTMPLRRSR